MKHVKHKDVLPQSDNDNGRKMLTIRLPKPFRFRGALIRTLKFPRPRASDFSAAVSMRRGDIATGIPRDEALGVHQLLTNVCAANSAKQQQRLFNAALKNDETAAAIDTAVFDYVHEEFFSAAAAAISRADEALKAFSDLASAAEFFKECMKQAKGNPKK